MRLLCLILFSVVTLSAVQPPVPQPIPVPVPADSNSDPKPIDPETLRKAEAVADAYVKAASVRPDPEAELILADIEIVLLEGRAFVDAKQPLKAGEKYLDAVAKRKGIPNEQRVALGERLRKADHQLLQLSRVLLGEAAFDLGDPPSAPPANIAPAASPTAPLPAERPTTPAPASK
jgi:hypothetical protein